MNAGGRKKKKKNVLFGNNKTTQKITERKKEKIGENLWEGFRIPKRGKGTLGRREQ